MLCAFPSEVFEDINPEADFMESKISKAVSLRNDPVAFIQVNEKPVKRSAVQKSKAWLCHIRGLFGKFLQGPDPWVISWARLPE